MRRRSAISWNSSPDIGFDRAVNPYRGCEHGCIYCYARPTHAYLGYSPGLDFETKLIFKPEVAELLEKELRKPGYIARTLALGSNTDPYQPVERTLKLTRVGAAGAGPLQPSGRHRDQVGRRAARSGHPDARWRSGGWRGSTSRSPRWTPRWRARMEPRAATPARRLHAIAELTRAGVPAGVMVAPMIPGLNDAEMEKIVEAAARAGARHAGYVLLRLPHELRQMFEDWLATHFPDRAQACAEPDPRDAGRRVERCPVPSPLRRPGRLCRPAAAPVRPRHAAMGTGRGARRAGLRASSPCRTMASSGRRSADVTVLGGEVGWESAAKFHQTSPNTPDHVLQQPRDRALEAVAPQAAAEGDRADGEHRAAGRRVEIHDLAARQVRRSARR